MRDLEKSVNKINFRHDNKHRDAQLLVYCEPMCFSLRIRSFGLISGCLIASTKMFLHYCNRFCINCLL